MFIFTGENKCKVSLNKCIQEERRLLYEQSNKIPLKNSYLLSSWMTVRQQSVVSTWWNLPIRRRKQMPIDWRCEQGSETVRTERKRSCMVDQGTPAVWRAEQIGEQGWGERHANTQCLNKEHGVRSQITGKPSTGGEGEVFDSDFVQLNRDREKWELHTGQGCWAQRARDSSAVPILHRSISTWVSATTEGARSARSQALPQTLQLEVLGRPQSFLPRGVISW